MDPRALTGLLNSTLAHFWLDRHGKKQGRHLQVDVGPLRQLPLAPELPAGVAELALRLGGLAPDSHEAFEVGGAIDRLVYRAYALEPDHVALLGAGV